MRVLPILFNTEMVQAILDGRKTVTRRLPSKRIEEKYLEYEELVGMVVPPGSTSLTEKQFYEQYPPYQPGDILYVRETWNKCGNWYRYKADWEKDDIADITKWRPSIHMPKEAARIWLKVTDVRVERLQESGKSWCLDIEKEGVVTPQAPILYVNDDMYHDALREEFQNLWNSTIKKSDLDRYGWEANPWVWVIEFERCEKPEPCILRGIEPAEDKRPCIGYGRSEDDDELCEMCKGCKQCSGNDEFERCEKPESEDKSNDSK